MISELTKKEAAGRFNELEQKGFKNLSQKEKDLQFRAEMLRVSEMINRESEKENYSLYQQDLLMGLNLYKFLEEIYGVSVREASQDGKWRYLSLNVVPDLIHNRWGFNEARFYQHTTRMYFKSLWWYIYLSWQGTEEETYHILKDHTTDDLVQLVERTGSRGYRVSLYREIMKCYSEVESMNNHKKNELFRKVMKLNTARVKTIEPVLYEGGIQQYVKELFDYFD